MAASSSAIGQRTASHSLHNTIYGISSPFLYSTCVLFLLALLSWPRRWFLSGAPILELLLLLGASGGYRVLPAVPLWSLATTIDLTYAIASTSWLLYLVFAILCYSSLFLVSLFQFQAVSTFARVQMRKLLKELHFIDDKIGFFDIPAMEIDTEVDGLFVLRGITFSLSTLSFVVHGVEVGIKLSEDMELAIQTEEVTVRLFRGIEVKDCYANLKGGLFEMTFGQVMRKKDLPNGANSLTANGTNGTTERVSDIFDQDTELLRAATNDSGMQEETANGLSLENSTAEDAMRDVQQISVDDDEERYHHMLSTLRETNTIHLARTEIEKIFAHPDNVSKKFDAESENDKRAAICSKIHVEPSVPHPPRRCIKVTTLQKLAPPRIRSFLRRLPMLLRLLLNPLAYFHPVKIDSITCTGSGAWIDHMLVTKIFRWYASDDSDIKHLRQRISSWTKDSNFAIQMVDFTGIAQVPFVPGEITCYLGFGDVMGYRALTKDLDLQQVVRLGGADATFLVPSFLLPHHEHLLPGKPSREEVEELKNEIGEMDGKPKEVQKEHEFKQAARDEANVKISAHARLPAVFDQELLNWIAALVKASKVIEMKDAEGEISRPGSARESMDEERDGFVGPRGSVDEERRGENGNGNGNGIHHLSLKDGLRLMKGGIKRKMVDGLINDRWISKVVGKITKKLEGMKGDIGYADNIPVDLAAYRLSDEARKNGEGEKLLP